MVNEKLTNRIRNALKKGFFKGPDDLVDVSSGSNGNIHLVIDSRKLDGRRIKEIDDLIWSELTKKLKPEEWEQITLSVAVSPEDVKAI